MEDKFRSIIPYYRVVQVLDLVTEEKESHSKAPGMICKQSLFVTSGWHGRQCLLVASPSTQGFVVDIPQHILIDMTT